MTEHRNYGVAPRRDLLDVPDTNGDDSVVEPWHWTKKVRFILLSAFAGWAVVAVVVIALLSAAGVIEW